MLKKKCACGKEIMSHWKHCEDCTKPRDVIHDVVYGVSLREQNLKKENEKLKTHNEHLMRDLGILEHQYAVLQENFQLLASHKVTIQLEKLKE